LVGGVEKVPGWSTPRRAGWPGVGPYGVLRREQLDGGVVGGPGLGLPEKDVPAGIVLFHLPDDLVVHQVTVEVDARLEVGHVECHV